jgi:hypothetical protein
MPQREIDAALEVLIACAVPDGPPLLYDAFFFSRALRSGKVGPEMLERAARAVVQPQLVVAFGEGDESDILIATVTPRRGRPIFDLDQAPRFVFGGMSLDGGAWTAGSMNRKVYSIRLTQAGTLPAGTRSVRARGWIVVPRLPWDLNPPAFGSDGEIVPPAGALGVYPLELEATVVSE